ncbi:MAG: hypothetical protein COB16_07040 [Rhodobacteraceae bacterium]|nr:MAG: hypothetical protein COB16_07040 [Paracoccaceae bacterium]
MASAEVMTACENICRNFGWLSEIVEPVLRLVPSVAILWAVFVYFHKRRTERQADDSRELRATTMELIDVVHKFRRAHINGESQLWDYYLVLDKLRLLLGGEFLSLVTEHEMAIKYFARTELEDEVFGQMRRAEEDCFDNLLLKLRESFATNQLKLSQKN